MISTTAFYIAQIQEVPMIETHAQVVSQKRLPNVGQIVQSKDYNTLWRVMERREIWENIPDDPETGDPRMVPAIYILYWKVHERGVPGVGKMLGYAYTLHDNTFQLHWDILK